MSNSLAHDVSTVRVPFCPDCGQQPAAYARHEATAGGFRDGPPLSRVRTQLIWDCTGCGKHVLVSADSTQPTCDPQ